jgi:hypothetical protein
MERSDWSIEISKNKPRVFFTGDFIVFFIHCCVGIAGKI